MLIDEDQFHLVRGKCFQKDQVFFHETENRSASKLAHDKLMLNKVKKRETEREKLLNQQSLIIVPGKFDISQQRAGTASKIVRESGRISGRQNPLTTLKSEILMSSSDAPISVAEGGGGEIIRRKDSDSYRFLHNNIIAGMNDQRSEYFDVNEQKMIFTKPTAFFNPDRAIYVNHHVKERIGTASYVPSMPCIQGVDMITRSKRKNIQRPDRSTINLIKTEKSELNTLLLQNSPRAEKDRRANCVMFNDPSIPQKFVNSRSINKLAELELTQAESNFKVNIDGLKEELAQIKKKRENAIPAMHPNVIEWHESAFRGVSRGQLHNFCAMWEEYDCRKPTLKGRAGWLANGSDHYSPFFGRLPR